MLRKPFHLASHYNGALGARGQFSSRHCSDFGAQNRTLRSPARPVPTEVRDNALSSVCRGRNDQKKRAQAQNAAKKRQWLAMSDADRERLKNADEKRKNAGEKFKNAGKEDAFYDCMPPSCDMDWKNAQRAWLDIAIKNPIILNDVDDSDGGCSVHILGVSQDDPSTPSALKALVDAVNPDTIAVEMPPMAVEQIRASAQVLAPLGLDTLVGLGFPAGIKEAHRALSLGNLERWRQALFDADKGLLANNSSGSLLPDFLLMYGRAPCMGYLAAAHLASSGQDRISLEGIDSEGRSRAWGLLQGKPGCRFDRYARPGKRQTKMNMFGSGIGGMKGWEGYDMIGKWSLTLEAKGLGYPRDFMDYNNLVISLMTGGSLSMDDDQHLGYLAQMSVIPSNHGEWDRLSYVSYAEEDMQEEEEYEMEKRGISPAPAPTGPGGDDGYVEMLLDGLKKVAAGQCSSDGSPHPKKCIVVMVRRHDVARLLALATSNKM